jgi:hypothetical protein
MQNSHYEESKSAKRELARRPATGIAAMITSARNPHCGLLLKNGPLKRTMRPSYKTRSEGLLSWAQGEGETG